MPIALLALLALTPAGAWLGLHFGWRATLASSLNIAAFNLGNALGAWVGGATIERGPGLQALGWVAALLTLVGLAIALWSRSLDRRLPAAAATACA